MEPEPEPAEEGEPDAFAVSVAGVTGAESFAVRAADTLRSLQLRIAESKLKAPRSSSCSCWTASRWSRTWTRAARSSRTASRAPCR